MSFPSIPEHPIFTKRLEPQTTLIRKSGEFRCRAVGVPYPKIRWFKDWHPLSESSRVHIKFEEPDTCVLTLNDAILKDGGLYTCTATNVAGTSTTSAMLSVEGKSYCIPLHSPFSFNLKLIPHSYVLRSM